MSGLNPFEEGGLTGGFIYLFVVLFVVAAVLLGLPLYLFFSWLGFDGSPPW